MRSKASLAEIIAGRRARCVGGPHPLGEDAECSCCTIWKRVSAPDPLELERDALRAALKEIQAIAAREWAADETNYEWYGDIAGIAGEALNTKGAA